MSNLSVITREWFGQRDGALVVNEYGGRFELLVPEFCQDTRKKIASFAHSIAAYTSASVELRVTILFLTSGVEDSRFSPEGEMDARMGLGVGMGQEGGI